MDFLSVNLANENDDAILTTPTIRSVFQSPHNLSVISCGLCGELYIKTVISHTDACICLNNVPEFP